MTTSTRYTVDQLVQQITDRLGWGEVSEWSNKDFERLSEQIFDQTQKRLSVTTLKRVWGRAAHLADPSHTTLDILAEFGGFGSWRDFQEQITDSPKPIADSGPRNRWWMAGAAVAAIGFVILFLWTGTSPTEDEGPDYTEEEFVFKRKVVAEGLPNSVVFSYDATPAREGAKVEIQQNWDARRRISVSQTDSIATCIYYYPGFFEAKLVIDSQIVAEDGVSIKTDGWLGVVDQDPMPLYLPNEEINQGDELIITPALLQQYGVDPMQEQVFTSLYKVDDFGELQTDDFDLSLQIQNQIHPQQPCAGIQIYLLYEGGAVSIPLSQIGCVANLSILTFDGMVDGSTHDLSAFGIEEEGFQHVGMKSDGRILSISLNETEIYQMDVPAEAKTIRGLSVHFEGMGSIKEVSLRNSSGPIYSSES